MNFFSEGIQMNKTLLIKSPLIAAAMLGLALAQATTVSRTDYNADKTRISAEYKADDARCDALTGNGKDVCVQQAKANEKVARADLEYRFTGTKSDARKATTARAEAQYAVAKEKCGARTGDEKNVCVQEAKAAQTKALAEMKMGKEVGDARTDAANDSRDADYKVAVERCDYYSGDTKSSCLTAAKAKFDKS
jgi:hypothetical protein